MDIKTIKQELELVLSEVNTFAPDPDYYFGAEAVAEAYSQFYKEFDFSATAAINGDADCNYWELTKCFIMVALRNDKENEQVLVIGVRDYGKYEMEPDNILLSSNFIPLYILQPLSAEKLQALANSVTSKLDAEINEMYTKYSKPIFLLSMEPENSYKGWSISENIFVNVKQYNANKAWFYLTYDSSKYDELIFDNLSPTYGIIPPSEFLIKNIGLPLSSYCLSHKSRNEKWFPRTLKDEMEVPEQYKECYSAWINLINQGRTMHYPFADQDDPFTTLESRVERFEKAIEQSVPGIILDDIVRLILEIFEKIELKKMIYGVNDESN